MVAKTYTDTRAPAVAVKEGDSSAIGIAKL